MREIPGKVFLELTENRETEKHNPGIQTCDMDHGLWLLLEETPDKYDTSLRVAWSWAEVNSAQVADSALQSGDDDDIEILASVNAGRYETGFISRDDYEVEQSVGLLVPRKQVSLSHPKSAEGLIYGLSLAAEIGRRSFILLSLGEYDKTKYWSKELDLYN